MDLPAPPKDIGLRNIIDKLAEFVARNGPEFEAITKAKQQGNPKFGFLYGGDYYQYYQWRVSSEQTILKQQGSLSQAQNLPIGAGGNAPVGAWDNNGGLGGKGHGPSHGDAMLAIGAQLEALNAQQATLRDQINQSEQNLSAQQGVLVQQQQSHIDEAIVGAQHDGLVKLAIEHNIRLNEFEDVLQPIVDSCTKDSISAGKNWILQHTTDSPKCNVILQYLLKKALLNGAPFTQKLHLIYLVNDVLHHCVRKRADDLKNQLENIVIPMFCSGQMQASDDQKTKLTKLLSLWESKANFFDACVISKLKSPASSMQEYKTNLMNTFATLVASITQQTNGTFESYKQQHQTFIHHAGQQIVLLETQKQGLLEKQKQASAVVITMPPMMTNNSVMAEHHPQVPQQSQQQQQQQQPPLSNPNNPFAPGNNMNNGGSGTIGNNMMQRNDRGPMMAPQQSMPNMNQPPPMGAGSNPNPFANNSMDMNNFANPEPPPSMFHHQNPHQIPPNHQQHHQQQHAANAAGFDQPPPNFQFPDMSKPPPGFANPPPPDALCAAALANAAAAAAAAAQAAAIAAQQQAALVMPLVPQEVKPLAPFYELPAGLMVPLIRLEDYEYRALDPEDLRLPPPVPPSERLLSAVDAFYAPPSHDRPRDGEGWEKLALYEYYKVKNSARKTKEEEITSGARLRSRSPSPIVIESTRPIKLNKRRYRSKSRSPSPVPTPLPDVDQSELQLEPEQEMRKSLSPIPANAGDQSQRKGGNSARKSSNYTSRSPKRASRSISPPPAKRTERSERSDRDRSDRGAMNESRGAREERESSDSPPPSFFGGNYAKPANDCIEETNKGHQMLMKMGWAGSGTGLGTHGQGIDAPISGGEVRDRQDQFKGVGISLNDPYENFRKNKGAAFIHRMRSRDTDRKVPSKNGSPEP